MNIEDMMNNSYKLDGIDLILNKYLQPWHINNDHRESYFQEQLRITPSIPMPEGLKFRLEYDGYNLFTCRVRYYCRLIDNAVADHLRRAFNIIDGNSSEYLTSYYLKMTRESAATLISSAVGYCQSLAVGADSLDNFIENRSEKEYLVILHYAIASLVRTCMEMQERYSYALNASVLRDVKSYYASVVGWCDAPIVDVKKVEEESRNDKNQSKVNTCSFLYINSDTEERNRCLSDFYQKLVHYELILNTTDQKHLFAVFGGANTSVTIEWTGKPATLKTVITKLFEKDVLAVHPHDSGYSKWYVIKCRFTYQGKPMRDLSSEKNRKKDTPMIEDIVSALPKN